MSSGESREITRILKEWNNGSEQAKELLGFVYEEMKRHALT